MKQLIFSLLFLVCSSAALAQQLPDPAGAARTALRQAGAEWRSADGDTYQSVSFPTPLAYPTKDAPAAARAFLAEYGPALGIDNPVALQLQSSGKGADGRNYLRFRQYRRGIPVLGGAATVAVTAGGGIAGFHGTLLPVSSFAPASAPTNDPDFVRLAREALLDKYPHAAQWNTTEGEQIWSSADPWHPGPAKPVYLTRTFVVQEPAGYRAERVFLDATSGRLVLRHQLHCDLNRRLYHRTPASINTVWIEGDAFPGGLDADDQELLTATAEFYNLMHRTFGRASFDGNNGQMRGITNASLSNCPNANAGGNVVRHCTGVVGDDIVAHEWTHNYISSMNGLIYAFESGAINEGFADIFGEALDLLNDRGNDTNDDQPRSGCGENNMRWLIAEDATAIDTTIRDMWLPECKEDASSRASRYYVCSPSDNGPSLVHTNSGLVNRTFALLVDGGAVGQDTVRGIGLTKALHIFHHANNHYLTQVTDFHALADMLVLSATNLLGTNLPALTLLDLPAMASDSFIRPADIEQLERAIRITQLRGNSACQSFPLLAQDPPDNCAGATVNAFGIILAQNWEDSLQNWSVTEVPGEGATWQAKPWRISGTLPDGRPGLGIFAPNPNTGNCNDLPDNGQIWLTSPEIALPAEETDFVLSFDHYLTTQEGYDGGLLFYARNGGEFKVVPVFAFLYNGYNGPLAAAPGNDNPLAGYYAFHGNDRNSTTGTWGRSIVDLNLLGLRPGDDLELRWVMSYDGCEGRWGWFLDDIKVGYCGLSALPVTFLRFAATAAKTHIRLNWATAAESDNAGFYVERRLEDGTDYRELGFVAAGNGNYLFDDPGVQPGVTYVYRLRQTDLDGTVHYSGLVSARIDGRTILTAYPNPVAGWLTVRAGGGAGAAGLFDMAGKKVAMVPLMEGFGRLSTAGLPAGVYVLRVGDEVVRVVVW